jgi:hypothetical protein
MIRSIYGQEQTNRILHKPIGDHISIVPRTMAQLFFSMHLAVQICVTREQKALGRSYINTEAIMGMWMVRNNLRYDVQNWFWLLVRDVGGRPTPECRRVAYIGRHKNISEALVKRCEEFKATGVLD